MPKKKSKTISSDHTLSEEQQPLCSILRNSNHSQSQEINIQITATQTEALNNISSVFVIPSQQQNEVIKEEPITIEPIRKSLSETYLKRVFFNSASFDEIHKKLSLQNLHNASSYNSRRSFTTEDFETIVKNAISGAGSRVRVNELDEEIPEVEHLEPLPFAPMLDPRKSILRKSTSIQVKRSTMLCLFESDTTESDSVAYRDSSEEILHKMILNSQSHQAILPREDQPEEEVIKNVDVERDVTDQRRSILKDSSHLRASALFSYFDAENPQIVDVVEFRKGENKTVVCISEEEGRIVDDDWRGKGKKNKSKEETKTGAKSKVDANNKKKLKKLEEKYDAAQEVLETAQKNVLFQTPSRLTTVINGEVHFIDSPSQLSLGSFSDDSSNSDITYVSCESDESDVSVCMYSNNS